MTLALRHHLNREGDSNDAETPKTDVHQAICIHPIQIPPEICMLAVRWYLRYGLFYQDVEELPAKRGIEVDHVTIYRWVQ